LPWTIFLYLGYFPFVFGALCGLREQDNMNRVAASMLLATAVTVPIFLIVPTAAPAVRIPELGGLNGFALAATTHANHSFHNVFPSMHAGYALLAAMGYRDERRRWYPLALAGAFLIAASTLLAKQHYVVDVPAGWLVAWACRSFVDRFVRFRFADA
jgi:membrane-associated phospholipid phosphatase